MLVSRVTATTILLTLLAPFTAATPQQEQQQQEQKHLEQQDPLSEAEELHPLPPHHPSLAGIAEAQGPDFLSPPTTYEAMSSSVARTAPLVFPAAGKHTATVIFAHGLGDTGHGWASAVENWRRRQRLDEVKFVLPHAPQIPITCNWGMRMPGWFDIKVLDGTVEALRESEDERGILASSEYFQQLVQAEVDAGIPAERVVLGGFSQGGAMAIFSGLTGKHRIGGIVGLSCWLLLSNKFAGLVPEEKANQETPVWLGHGDADPLVRPELGALSMDALKGLGYKVSRTLYPGMGHAACPEELDDVEAFLLERLPPTQK
ncbi:acyl-protein thioesterase 1 [Colletotrichum scovillei]|uniref:Acyl-protein thioesterase 1 n=1 Tax=Colletotrichum scovillei TaxID=1209932 RepID=A0A9P7RHU1_9PEZI|nr:acyl-protein thioesterase 1 [Colletotrichum scovillei]KAG7077239.1 acyl-protein thioesterase 1 [Colletotrichum scovillei]KAG7084355.1 acyl-protein thioesterase 1 [Colletotrichum scovillei]